MRRLQVRQHVCALIVSVSLGAGITSITPAFANPTGGLDDDSFVYPLWLTFSEDFSASQEGASATIDLPVRNLVYRRGPISQRTTDDVSEQDVFGYEIALSEAWNEKGLTRFFEDVESKTRLTFGQVMLSADDKTNASASIGTGVELRRFDSLEMDLEAEALYLQGGDSNDSGYDSQWFRGRTKANVFPWVLGEYDRLGFGLRSTASYNTPTGTEHDVWVHVGPVIRMGSDGFTVELLVGYYTSHEELDDDLPKEYTGLTREQMDFDVATSGVTSHIEIVKEFASGVKFIIEGGAQTYSDHIRQAGGRTSVRVPLTVFLGHLTGDAQVRNPWSRVSLQFGFEGRYFDLGSRHALPFHETIGGTFSIQYALQ